MAAVEVGDVKARVEGDLARVQDALAIVEEAKRKVWTETAHLKVEQTSLLLEIRAARDEVSSLHSQEGRVKEAMEKYY